MDFLKDAQKKFSGGGNSQPQQQPAQGGAHTDYLDKGFDAVTKKSGYGDKIKPDQAEKVTDGIRSGFEKLTGKHVPDKFSN